MEFDHLIKSGICYLIKKVQLFDKNILFWKDKILNVHKHTNWSFNLQIITSK